MKPLLSAVIVALLAAFAPAARAAAATETRDSGTVLTAEVADDPWGGGGAAGSLVIVDKAGDTAGYSVLGTTRVTRDGKDTKFDTSLVGNLVVRAMFDPATKTLTVLDLKSPAAVKASKKVPLKAAKAVKPAMAAKPVLVTGEVAFADAIKGELSVRAGKDRTLKFAVVETTTVLLETPGKPAQEIGFDTVAVGEAVEVRSHDGKTADQIRVHAAAR